VETEHVRAERRLLDQALATTGGCVALDAGCGHRTRLRNYRDRISRLVGVDVDEDAGRRNQHLDEYVVADLDGRLPFDDDTFDLVYANFVVEHLSAPEAAFGEWRRVLRPGGWVVLVTTNRASPFMALAERLPDRVRLGVKRRGAGVEERDVYPTRYLANTPEKLLAAAARAGLHPVSVEYVATLHRYGARVPGAGRLLRGLERTLPPRRRSTIVASFR